MRVPIKGFIVRFLQMNYSQVPKTGTIMRVPIKGFIVRFLKREL